MAVFINEPSHTFNEYLLIPGYAIALGLSFFVPKNRHTPLMSIC